MDVFSGTRKPGEKNLVIFVPQLHEELPLRMLRSLKNVALSDEVYISQLPIGSMYGIFTYIYHKDQPNVGRYTIHGWYGTMC